MTMRSALIASLFLFWVPPLAFSQGESGDQRVIFLEEPSPFDDTAAAELARLRDRLHEISRLHDPSVDSEQEKARVQEAQGLLEQIDDLRDRQRDWTRYQEALSTQPPDRSHPPFVEGGEGDPLDVRELFGLYRRFHALNFIRMVNTGEVISEDRLIEPLIEGLPEDTTLEGREVTWKQWEDLAREFDRYHTARFKLKNTRLGMFHLRTFMIQGKCWLYAAVEHWHDNRRVHAFRDYERGIHALHRVLTFVHGAKRAGDLERIDQFPEDMNRFLQRRPGDPDFQLYRRAGMRVTDERTTSSETRLMLGRFCPWGVSTYFFLKRIGCTTALDLDILPPLFDAEGLEQAPKISVQTLPLADVPAHIRRDMDSLMGGESRIGVLQYPGRPPAKIEWAALTKPTYTLWVISPGVFDLRPSEILSVTAHLRKIFFGFVSGEERMYGQKGYLLDVTFDQEVEFAEWQAGGKQGDFYGASKLFVDGMNVGFDQDLFFNYAEKGFNWTKLVHSIATVAFGWVEQKELEWLFDGLEPRDPQFGEFKTYDDGSILSGGRIPPILIRAEVYGFEKTESYEYHRTSRIVRHYVLDPGALSGLGDLYQLNDFMSAQAEPLANEEEYVAGNSAVQEKTWAVPPLNPPPPGKRPMRSIRRYGVDFAPKAQTVHLEFDEARYDLWRKESGSEPLEVRFYDGRESVKPANQQQDFARIPLNTPYVTAQFVNARLFPGGLSLPSPCGDEEWCFMSGIRGKMQFRLPDPDRKGPVLEPGALPAPDLGGWCVLWDLTRDYTVRVVAGDQVKAEFPLRFMGSKGRRITGKLTWPFDNVCLTHLRYPEVRNDPIKIKPQYGGLLPNKVVASAGSLYGDSTHDWEADTFELKIPYGDDYVSISANLTGYDLKQQLYRASVSLGGKTYTMLGKVRSMCGGAHMECEVPVPPGRHEVVVTVPEAKAIPYKFVIVREPCPYTVSDDLRRAQRDHAEGLAKFNRSRSAKDADTFADYCVTLADKLLPYGEYERAHELCLKALKLVPRPEDLNHDFILYPDLYEAAFHVGDGKSLLWAGKRAAHHRHGRELQELIQQHGRRHPLVALEAESVVYDLRRVLCRFVSVGGDPANAGKLEWMITDHWSMANFETDARSLQRCGFQVETGL
jgi:hypothetical protein